MSKRVTATRICLERGDVDFDKKKYDCDRTNKLLYTSTAMDYVFEMQTKIQRGIKNLTVHVH